MKTLDRKTFSAAIECGIEAFIKSVNKSLSDRAADEGQHDNGLSLPAAGDPGQTMRELIIHYISRYKERYGPKARPDVGPKMIGVLQRISKGYNQRQVSALLTTYLKLDDKWFQTKYHDLATFEQSLHRVLHATTTGLKAAEKTEGEKASDIIAEGEKKK